MKEQKKPNILGLVSLVLWAVLLTLIANLLFGSLEWDFRGPLFKIMLWVMLFIAAFFCWWIHAGLRLHRFAKRLDKVGFAYLESHDLDAYLTELDRCCEARGADRFVLSGIPARDYVTLMKIRALRESGRGEEALALLQTAKEELKSEKARLLLEAEEEKLTGQADNSRHEPNREEELPCAQKSFIPPAPSSPCW